MVPESEEVRAEYAKRGIFWVHIKPYFWQTWLDKFDAMPTDRLVKYYMAGIMAVAAVSAAVGAAQYLHRMTRPKPKLIWHHSWMPAVKKDGEC